MNGILSASRRKIDYTLDLSFPDETFYFATAPLFIDPTTYVQNLESVGEVRQTLESPTDRVGIKIQNKDRVLGLHVAAYWEKWRSATAVIGRLYRDDDGLGLSEWVELFRGAVQRPDVDDTGLQVIFDVIPDTLAPGEIVCNRTLALICWFVFKDPRTCAYTGSETSCNHLLKSKEGCDGRGNSHHNGSMEHRYPVKEDVPGTGGNGIDPVEIGHCPRLDQYVLVRDESGRPQPKQVYLLTESDCLFNPITRTFHAIASLEIVLLAQIGQLVTANGAATVASNSHPIIQGVDDGKGKALERLSVTEAALTWLRRLDALADSHVVSVRPCGFGDVMKIEMADGHIYACGASPEAYVVAHNVKAPFNYENLP